MDTPRSGVATPQPDLHDKRLPGIMSYFSQVRQDPSTIESSAFSASVAPASASARSDQPSNAPLVQGTMSSSGKRSQSPPQNSSRRGVSVSDCRRPSRTDKLDVGAGIASTALSASSAYPTPPPSQPSHSGSSSFGGGHVEAAEAPEVPPKTDSLGTIAAKASAASTHKDSDKTELPASDEAHSSPIPSSSPPEARPPLTSNPSWFSLEGLKELTRGVIFKSGPPTPTRALSAAHSSHSDGRETPGRTSHDGAEVASGIQTPRTAGVQPPAPKGKLTIKIMEARGLRRCRDPYVVAVFQRSELISGGPRPVEEEEVLSATPSSLGGIPIQRQGSDSGRPPMAIPMRSRQSSNTSLHEYNTFRNRTTRSPLTNPKWDAEAVL